MWSNPEGDGGVIAPPCSLYLIPFCLTLSSLHPHLLLLLLDHGPGVLQHPHETDQEESPLCPLYHSQAVY